MIRGALGVLVAFGLACCTHAGAKELWLVQDDALTWFDTGSGMSRMFLSPARILDLAPVGRAGAWLLTETKLVLLDEALSERASADLLPDEFAAGGPLAVEPSGGLWIAAGSRVIHFDATGTRIKELWISEPVRAIAIGGPDALFVATMTSLARYDASGRMTARADLGQLPGSGVSGMLLDSLAGMLWLARSDELIQFDVLLGISPRASIPVPQPDAIAIDVPTGFLTAISGREVRLYDRDARPISPLTFTSEPFVALAGSDPEVRDSLLWFGDGLGVGAVDISSGVVLRIPGTLPVRHFAAEPTRVATYLAADTSGSDPNGVETHIALVFTARCDDAPCNPTPAFLRNTRLRVIQGDNDINVFRSQGFSGQYAGRMPIAPWQIVPPLKAWVTDAWGNRSDAAYVAWPIATAGAAGRRVVQAATPTVSIAAPTNNAGYTAPASITITATAAAGTGATITKVDFYAGTTLLGTKTASPYSFSWTNVQVATYVLTAKVTNSAGATATSAPITVVVKSGTLAKPLDAYLLNEAWVTGGAVVDAGGVHNGTASGAVSPIVAAALGTKPDTCNAASFAGGAMDVAGLTVSTAAAAKTTLTFWINWSGSNSVMPAGWVTQGLIFSGGSFGFYTGNNDVFGISSAGLANGWHHMVAEFTNGGVTSNKIYVDGIPQTLTQRAGTPTLANAVVAATLRIGGLGGSTSFRFAGQLDEIKVFNRALTATEVSAEFAAANACGTLPTSALTAPATNANYAPPASIAMTATAAPTATGATVNKVEFYNGSTLLGASIVSPYAYTWTGVGAGDYSLTAHAVDSKGTIGTSPAALVHVKVNAPPTVALTAPVNNSAYTAPATINLAAAATDVDGSVAKVEFYQGTTRLATLTAAPYAYTWTNVAGATYSLTAKATDDKGAVTTSAAVSVQVNKPPTVSITAPANNAQVAIPGTVTINASASDSDGTISKVEFFSNGALIATDTTSPYSYSWPVSTAGTYVLTAKATDNLGVATTSATVIIAAGVNQPPTVSLTAPANGAHLVSDVPVTFTATAADPDGSIVKVDFYADFGVRYLLGTDTKAPYSVTQTLSAYDGFVLTAVATDNKGATTTSAPVTVSVAQNQVPTVTLTTPVDLQTFVSPLTLPNIPLAATASDPDGKVVAVRFYKQGDADPTPVLLGTVTAAPYQMTWNAVPYGSYWVWAEATDDANSVGSVVSYASIYVQQTSPRTISIASPDVRDGGVTPIIFSAPATIVVSGVSTLAYGSDDVAKVEFLANGVLVGTVATANGSNGEFVTVWRNVPAGTYAVNAKLTDVYGASVTSSDISIQVVGASQAGPTPTVTLLSPASGMVNGSTPTGRSPIALLASVTDPNGVISNVQFFADNQWIALATAAPYSATWLPPAGVHVFRASAYNSVGQVVATSREAYVTVPVSSRQPLAVLTSPSPTGTYAVGVPVTLAVDALALDGTISKVDFYAGTTFFASVATPPYSVTAYFWSPGSQPIFAKVTVPYIAPILTAPVTINVAGSGPVASIAMTSPTEGQQFVSPATVPLAVNLVDPAGIVIEVRYYLGAYSTLVATATHAPWTASWTGAGAAQYPIIAVGFSASAAVASSAPVTVTLISDVAPSVSIATPTSGQTFYAGQPITLSANATDSDGTIAKVEFYSNGALIGTANSAPWSMIWTGATTGSYSLTAKATDNAGAASSISTAVPITIGANVVPTVALALPQNGQTFAAGATINLVAKAADSDGTVARIDFYAGSTLLGSVTSAPYSFAWTGVPAASYALTARAVDNRGALMTSSPVNVTVQSMALTITTPADGATIAADFVLVKGTYQGPPNSGVTVNGVVAVSDGQGNFLVNNFPLTAGANTLTITLNTADGQSTSQTRTVTSTGMAPFQIVADPDTGFAPLSATLRVTNRTSTPLSTFSFANVGAGVLDTSGATADAIGKISYSSPGTYTPTITLVDGAGHSYTQTVVVQVQDRAVLDQHLKALWNAFSVALAAGDTQTASAFISSAARMRYAPVFASLATQMPTIVANWAAPQTGSLDTEIAEYTVGRVIAGEKRRYFIMLLRDDRGIWQIDTM